MAKSFLEKALPVAALGATGFGLAGMGPLAGLLGSASAAGEAGAAGAAALPGTIDSAGLIPNAATGTLLNPEAFIGAGSSSPLFTGLGTAGEKAATLANGIMPGEWDWMKSMKGDSLLKIGQMFNQPQQPQAPQAMNTNVQIPMQRQSMPPGSFMDSSQYRMPPQDLEHEKWLMRMRGGYQ